MARLSTKEVWEKMALSKIENYPNENWFNISLWSQFNWSDVSQLIKTRKLITNMHKSNKVIWVRPTAETYILNIEPLVKQYQEGFKPSF
jgi:hypothetical protein